jgi:hypothetical protein
MKKIILLLNFCLLLQSAKAQITVNYIDQKGTYIYACDSVVPNSISIGSKGTNQTWDFTGLRNIYQDTTIFMDASGTPYFSKFPNANYAEVANSPISGVGKGYGYYYLDANNHSTYYGAVAHIWGQDLIAYASQPCIDTLTVLTYGKTNIDTLTISEAYAYSYLAGMDSIKSISQEITFDTVDAWGTVILPGNFSYNSLRLKSITYNKDDTYIKYYGTWILTQTSYDTVIAYNWDANFSSQPMVEIFLDSSGQILSSQYYLANNVTGLQSNALLKENMTAYPNPARTNFSLDISGIDNSPYSISLVNSTGEIFFPEWNSKNDVMQVNTEALKGGLYHWMLKNDEGKFYQGSILID